jgi:hypothetical protein
VHVVEWKNLIGGGGTPFVTVSCTKCSGKAVLEKVFESTRFLHCGRKDEIPPAVLEAHKIAVANVKSGKPASKFVVHYI